MIAALIIGIAVGVGILYYAHKHASTVAAVKAEFVKFETTAKADVSAASAEVKAYVAKLEALVASVKAKL